MKKKIVLFSKIIAGITITSGAIYGAYLYEQNERLKKRETNYKALEECFQQLLFPIADDYMSCKEFEKLIQKDLDVGQAREVRNILSKLSQDNHFDSYKYKKLIEAIDNVFPKEGSIEEIDYLVEQRIAKRFEEQEELK